MDPSTPPTSKRKADETHDHPSSKKPNSKGEHFCHLCNVDCNSSAVFAVHCNGKKHKAKELVGARINEKEEKFYCEVCEISCNSEVVMAAHLSGKKHKAKEGEKDKRLLCEVCKVWCNSEAMMEIHVNGRRHKAKAKEDTTINEGEKKDSENGNDTREKESTENGEKDKEEDEKEFWCFTCRVKCDSQGMMAKHLKGEEHKEKARLRLGRLVEATIEEGEN